MRASPPSPPTSAPVSQGKTGFRKNWPEWMRQLPQIRFPPPKPDFQLLDPAQLNALLEKANPDVRARLETDLKYLEGELLRMFRERDYEAKFQQNRYRLYQIAYMSLATAATLAGSLLAVSLRDAPATAPLWGFIETLIALLATFLSALSSREPPLPLWIENRRISEQLRREYFRFLMDLEPYDALDGYMRRRTLSMRAAHINRGTPPDVISASVDTHEAGAAG